MQQCPCGSHLTYANCCGRFIDGKQWATTPEELMRSRYTAYTKANTNYIALTMKSPAADDFDIETTKKWASSVEWKQLKVISSSQQETTGYVEFLANYTENKKNQTIHELSEFHLENGKWYYIDGRSPTAPIKPIRTIHTGRNDPCSCGSGKKYKKCCG